MKTKEDAIEQLLKSVCKKLTWSWGPTLIEPRYAKTCFMPCVNNKGADQPVHPRSLISTFIVRFLDSTETCSCFARNFKPVVIFCSYADRFESYQVGNLRRRVFLCRGSVGIVWLSSSDVTVVSTSHSCCYCQLIRGEFFQTATICKKATGAFPRRSAFILPMELHSSAYN